MNNHAFAHYALVFGLGLSLAWPAFTPIASAQSAADESNAIVAAVTTPAAYIYIQIPQGIDVYTVTSAGKPTLLKGSPFPVTGLFQGVNGRYLITVGTYWLHSYAIEPSGAVGDQVSKIDTQTYGGSQCGPTFEGGVLDHTGKYFYVSLASGDGEAIGDGGCAVLQTYQIESSGQFKYLDNTDNYGSIQGNVAPGSVPTISSNDKFAYGMLPEFEDGTNAAFSLFKIAANGELQGTNGGQEDGYAFGPAPNPDCNWFYYPTAVAADNAGHVAAVLNLFACDGPPQLASYTIKNDGTLTTKNTWADMPVPHASWWLDGVPGLLSMSPSGKILAVQAGQSAQGGPGLMLFHFNGAAPITPYKTLLPSVSFAQPVAWDSNNHLYAFGNGLLYVFKVTPTEITEVPGAPFKLRDTGGAMYITSHAW
jgi:hypothetical protein